MKITLINDMGVRKEVKIGFSWTTLFFGLFVPLFRGDLKWFFIQLISAIFTYGISHFIYAFIYNRIYIKELLTKGYRAATEDVEAILRSKGYIV